MALRDAHTCLVLPDEPLPAGSLCPWRTFHDRLQVLRGAGVVRALASLNRSVADRSADEFWALNQRIAAACAASDGLLMPSAFVQPALGQAARDLLRRCRHELGMVFVGEMFDRHLGFEWGTPDYWALLECAVELRMLPLIHCEDAVACEIADRLPNGRFLIAHLRGASTDPADRARAFAGYANLHVVTSGCEIAQAGVLERFGCLGAHRVVFEYPTLAACIPPRRSG